MSRFIGTTMEDIRCGRQNWRVFGALSTIAFIISIATAMLHTNF